MNKEFDLDKSKIKLFCNRVFVSDDCKEIVPKYLMTLEGVLDSPDIPLNVSRSYLQMDRTVRQLGQHISKKVSDSLGSLWKADKDKYISNWTDLSIVVKLGAMEDNKFFERVKPYLIFSNTQESWINLDEYLENNKDKTNDKILYTKDLEMTEFIDAYKAKGIDVLLLNSPIDTYLIPQLEQKAKVTFQRIDGAIDENMIDKEREKSILDDQGKTEASNIADLIRTKLNNDKVDVQAKSLTTDDLPAFIVLDEAQRRMRDQFASMYPDKANDMPFDKKTFIVNTNNPLINSLEKLNQVKPEMAEDVVQHVYDIALLNQKELKQDQLQNFTKRQQKLLSALVEIATQND